MTIIYNQQLGYTINDALTETVRSEDSVKKTVGVRRRSPVAVVTRRHRWMAVEMGAFEAERWLSFM